MYEGGKNRHRTSITNDYVEQVHVVVAFYLLYIPCHGPPTQYLLYHVLS
jgi:hypothetical protein